MVEEAPFVLPTYLLTKLNRGNVSRCAQKLTSQESTVTIFIMARIAPPYPILPSAPAVPMPPGYGFAITAMQRNST